TPAANFNGTVNFTYAVSDGTASVNASAALDVTPVNDAPTNLSFSGTTVVEAAAVGVVFGVVSASDVDANDTLVFSLAPGQDAGGRFAIDPTTGEL
ncbi:cadherin-like domain-containing protein, partial [Clostridium perfringens]|uniref:cadherin-like domain-containing protein n=1 Tax=Clostridium perfringens TaxID=1502 RepID=UPI00375512CB